MKLKYPKLSQIFIIDLKLLVSFMPLSRQVDGDSPFCPVICFSRGEIQLLGSCLSTSLRCLPCIIFWPCLCVGLDIRFGYRCGYLALSFWISFLTWYPGPYPIFSAQPILAWAPALTTTTTLNSPWPSGDYGSQCQVQLQRLSDLSQSSLLLLSLLLLAAETESIGSYTVVSALEEQRQPVRRGETRDEIERSFGRCPRHLFAQASRLVGPVELCERRIERAWLAGRWAGAVVAGRASSPNRTEQLAVRSRVYIILRAPGLESPKVVHSSADYFRVVGRLHDSSSLSHSFPCETEARIYCEAAGFTYPISQQQWLWLWRRSRFLQKARSSTSWSGWHPRPWMAVSRAMPWRGLEGF